MRRFAIAALLAILMTALYVVGAGATSGAHFMSDTSASVTDSGALSVFIDEAGLGQATVDYTLTWSGTAHYGCINGGGNHPQATNKETFTSGGATSFSETPKNGRVMATVLVPDTPPPAPPFCPSGQTQVLADVSYTATLTDTTNSVSIDLSASRIFFTFKK
jgi:hypothetical protein